VLNASSTAPIFSDASWSQENSHTLIYIFIFLIDAFLTFPIVSEVETPIQVTEGVLWHALLGYTNGIKLFPSQLSLIN